MPNKRILIADDMSFYRTALRDVLRRHAYEVVGEASDGAQAVKLAAELAPDIAILDIVMPVKTGLDAAAEIRRLNPAIKIVMCSSLGNDAIVAEARSTGASGYIIKPFDDEAVLEALAGC
ncbi:MAG: response regulator [Deltaproteobacteria bacterium]